MIEDEEDEKKQKGSKIKNKNSINELNSNKADTKKLYSCGVLDKLHIINGENNTNNLLQKTNIALIKSSNDLEIEELIKKLTGTENCRNNIGIRKTIKIISGKVKINNICLYDYNYYVFNKYAYLKKEVLKNCDIYVIICNIFEQKLEIFFTDFIEILRKNPEYGKKKIVFLLIGATNNFLMNMVSPEQLILVKEQISFLFKNYKHFCINTDINEVDVDHLLQEIINV
mgnify:CR=1 FL=1